MTTKTLIALAVTSRFISYLLVFYSGLAIGVAGAEAGQSPIWTLVCSVLFGAAASVTTEIAVYEEAQKK